MIRYSGLQIPLRNYDEASGGDDHHTIFFAGIFVPERMEGLDA
jgi:hypothetical protein